MYIGVKWKVENTSDKTAAKSEETENEDMAAEKKNLVFEDVAAEEKSVVVKEEQDGCKKANFVLKTEEAAVGSVRSFIENQVGIYFTKKLAN